MEFIAECDKHMLPTELCNIKYSLPLINSYVIEVSNKNISKLKKIKSINALYPNKTIDTQMNIVRDKVKCINTKYTGKGISIAFIDTGICKNNDFDSRIKCFYDVINHKNYVYDDCGHGTHVAGICSGSGANSNGKYRGIAPESNIVMIKALDFEGKGTASDVLTGIQWVADNYKKYNIRILNMSIGAGITNTKDPLVRAAEILWDMGIVVVAAAGNNGPQKGTISSPGISKKIITVGSVDDINVPENDIGKSYSGRGPTKECVIKPDVVAPGTNIISCLCEDNKNNNYYKSLSGTSMSTPIVSGAIALLLEKAPNLKPDDIKFMLKQSCHNLECSPNRQGWGLLDIENLLNREVIYVRK